MALAYRKPRPFTRTPLELVAPADAPALTPSPQLWLALMFPALPLEALGVRAEERAAVVVLEAEDARTRICAMTAGAVRSGVQLGMTAQAALAVTSHIKLIQRNPAAEHDYLERLAAWCERLTPTISVQAPDALLLEMRGSLHLFSDAQTLRTRLHTGFASQGHRVCVAFTPTPRAALWCARARLKTSLDSLGHLRGELGRVPLAALRWPDTWQTSFTRLGLHTLADLLRLPREGLGRRFGPEILSELDRALGIAPDPLPLWTPSVPYQEETDLGFDTWQTGALLPVIESLLSPLAHALQARDAGLRSFELQLCGYHSARTIISVGTRDPSRNLAHWMRLVRTQLEPLRLTHPVHVVRVVAGRFEPLTSRSEDFFTNTAQSSGSPLAQLIDTLRARLGRRGVTGLRTVATRRPERASRLVPPDQTKASPIELPARPFWLLNPPKPLATGNPQPHHAGHGLVIESGPERIECGGWLGWEIRRDYYVARDPRGSRLWIYRELGEPTHWYLQGYFA